MKSYLSVVGKVFKYLPLVSEVINLAEELKGPGTGPEKRAAVIQTTKDLLAVFQPDLVIDPKLEALVGALIDYIVARKNASGELPTPAQKE